MKKPAKGRPSHGQVTTPYGLPALVASSERLVAAHVLSDCRPAVEQLSAVHRAWEKFLTHTGWMDPAGAIGVLDTHFTFASAALEDLSLNFYVHAVEGGAGEPLYCDHTVRLVWLRLSLSRDGWGILNLDHLSGATPEWVEWAQEAAALLRQRWEADIGQGKLHRLSNLLAREDAVGKWQAEFWSADNLKGIRRNLALQHLHLIDDEEEASEHCSSLEFKAQAVHLVTPWLADELKKRGAIADTLMGLPVWSRDNRDAPHLEYVLQDIAYTLYGHSLADELATDPTPRSTT